MKPASPFRRVCVWRLLMYRLDVRSTKLYVSIMCDRSTVVTFVKSLSGGLAVVLGEIEEFVVK